MAWTSPTMSCPSTSRWVPQCGVEYGAVLGDVDVRAREHLVPPLLEPDLARQLDEGAEDRVVDEVLGQVDMQVARVEGEPVNPARVLVEHAAQIGCACGREVGQACPRGGRRRVHGQPIWPLTVSSSSTHDFLNLSTPSVS